MDELIALIMQLLQSSPEQPAGDVSDQLPSTASPPAARQMNDRDMMMSQLMGLMQQLQMGQGAQQSRNAAAGAQGGPMGFMGGRPRGS